MEERKLVFQYFVRRRIDQPASVRRNSKDIQRLGPRAETSNSHLTCYRQLVWKQKTHVHEGENFLRLVVKSAQKFGNANKFKQSNFLVSFDLKFSKLDYLNWIASLNFKTRLTIKRKRFFALSTSVFCFHLSCSQNAWCELHVYPCRP